MALRAEIPPLTRPRVHKLFLHQFDVLRVPGEVSNIVRESDDPGLRLKRGRHGLAPWRRCAPLKEPQSQRHSQREQGTIARPVPAEEHELSIDQIFISHFLLLVIRPSLAPLITQFTNLSQNAGVRIVSMNVQSLMRTCDRSSQQRGWRPPFATSNLGVISLQRKKTTKNSFLPGGSQPNLGKGSRCDWRLASQA